MSSKTPADYDREDGFNEQNGLEECPHCSKLYCGNGGYLGEVYGQDGQRYEFVLDTDPADGPFFCPDCWAELEANQKATEHKQLTEWSQ